MHSPRNHGGYFKNVTAVGLTLLLMVVLPSCGGPKRHMPTWSRVQALSSETETEVRLYKDEAPPGSHKIAGHFHSATDDSVTLTLPDGQRRTLQKQFVREVLTHRSFAKRWPGWLTLGVSIVTVSLLLPESGERPWTTLLVGGLVGLPFSFAAFQGSRMAGIYDVPSEYRTPPPPAKQPNAGKKPGKNPQ